MRGTADKYRSELARRHFSAGEVHGEARGWAKSVLIVLDERQVEVSGDDRERILGCTSEETLSTWLSRALTADSAAQLSD